MKIISCSALEIINHPDFEELRKEYIAECANAHLPIPKEKLEMYKALDNSGTLHCFCAMEDEKMLGFVMLLAPILPHYGRLIAITESLFVAKAYRKSGAGLRLIRCAEKCAKELGSPAILSSAPLGGSLDKLLPRLKYTATNRAYIKDLT